MEPKFISPVEAAELLGISRSSVDRLAKSGRMPSYLIGKRRVFDKQEVIAWVKSHPGAQAQNPPAKKAERRKSTRANKR